MQIPLPLRRHLADGRCILFVGAGLSAAAGLPTWGSLLDQVIGELESGEDRSAAELRALWKAGKYLEVADHCADANAPQLRATLASLVRGATEPIPEVHKAIRELPFVGVVTTNYDKLLERAFSERVPKVHTHASQSAFGTLLFDRAFFILKAHGDIDEPETIVLSTKSYRELIHANPAFNAVMSAILLNFSILFVGYSLNDPDFRLLIERQITDFRGTTPIRYALMDGLGSVEAQILQRNAGIQVIPYPKGKHEEVLAFFRQLRDGYAPAAAAPATAFPTAAEPARERSAPRRGSPDRGAVRPAARTPAPPPPAPERKPATPFAGTTLRIRASGTVIEATLQKGLYDRLMTVSTGILGPVAGLLTGAMFDKAAGLSATSQVGMRDWAAVAHGVGRAVAGSSREAIGEVGRELRKCFSPEILDMLARLRERELVYIAAEGPLQAIPWEWLDVGGQPLCLARPVFRASPSAAVTMPLPPSVLVIGAPHGNLPGAAREADQVAHICGSKALLLKGSEAAFGRVVSLLDSQRFDVLHFAGHAWVQDDQSYLYLAEETGIGARELRSFISRNPPAIVFLNSHYTAFVPIGVSVHGVSNVTMVDSKALPANVFGFMEMASSAGVGAFIGCIGSPLDETSQEIGVAFHRALADGVSAAEALWRARTQVAAKRKDDPSPFLFVGSGFGLLRAESPA